MSNTPIDLTSVNTAGTVDEFLDDLVNKSVEKSLYETVDRGFIGPADTTPFVYYYKIELGSYGYLDANFEIARLGSSSTGIYMDNSISTLSSPKYNERAEQEIADSLSIVDGTIHALQNYRRDLLEAIEKYKNIRDARMAVEEKAGV